MVLFRFQRNAWSSVARAMRQSRSLRISTFLRGNRLRILRLIHVATADFQQLQLIFKVVDISFVLQRLISRVLATTEIPQFFIDKVIDAPVVQVERVPGAVVDETAEFGVLTASCDMELAHS